ncbi:MAG: acyltransferase [Cyclobacteriaceae bacterium]
MRLYLPYLHFLRGVAILYVIGVHARGFHSYWQSSSDTYHILDVFSDPSEGNGTALFLFIGGFLFQHLTTNSFVFGKYLNQKFKVLISPYLLISIPLILIRLNTNFQSSSLPEYFHERSVTYKVIHFLLTGSHLPPFWFISTIILFYISAPMLHALDNRKFYNYIFPFILLVSMFTYRPEHNANPFLSYLHFIPIYITGMWASFHKERILKDNPRIFYSLLFIYAGMCIGELSGWLTHDRSLSFQDVLSQGILVFNVYRLKALVLCFMWLSFFYLFRDRKMPLLERLGAYSFGLFFVHYFFISITRKLLEFYNITTDFTLLTYLIYFAFILGISTVTVYLIKRVTGNYSRYLIGS